MVHVDLAAVQRVRVHPRLLAIAKAGDQRAEQYRDHLVKVGTGDGAAGDSPQVELVRGPGVLPVDGVAAVHDPQAHKQHVIGGIGGKPAQRGRDHRAGMAAQHAPGRHVPGVAGIAGDRLGRVSEPVVIVDDRHDPRPAAPADLAAPGTAQRNHGLVNEELNGVRAIGRVREIPDAKVAAQQFRLQIANERHRDSSVRRTAGMSPPGPGSPERSRRLNAARRLLAAHPGPGGGKIAVPAAQSRNQASVCRRHLANRFLAGRPGPSGRSGRTR